MTDIVERAQAALEGLVPGPWAVESHQDGMSGTWNHVVPEIEQFRGYRNNVNCGEDRALAEFIAAARTLVPELAAETEQLREAGPWTEHVERQRAMKRQRDGECICNTGPDTDGPDEYCPWHGRPYAELLESLTRQAAVIEQVRATAEYWRGDEPRLPQALRQGADTLLAMLEVDR